MKLLKRIMETALIAVLGLTMMTACGGEGGVSSRNIEWENSRTYNYFSTRGITPEQFMIKATVWTSPTAGYEFQHAVKGKLASCKISIGEMQVDKNDNVYKYELDDRQLTIFKYHWVKYLAQSKKAIEEAPKIRVGYNYFTVPVKQNIVSILASTGEYSVDGKEYYTETIKLKQNNTLRTYVYGYDGTELKFIQTDVTKMTADASGITGVTEITLGSIELKGVADEKAFELPEYYQTVKE